MRKIILCALVLMALLPALAMAQNWNLTRSPTNEVTFGLFREAVDVYMDSLFYGELVDPIFMFKFVAPTSTVDSGPNEFGFGGRVAAFYGAAFYGYDGSTNGLLGGGQSTAQYVNDTLIMAADNATILGKNTAISEQIRYTVYNYQNPQLLFGFDIGQLKIGVKESFLLIENSELGTYRASDASPLASTISEVKMLSAGAYVTTFSDALTYAKVKKPNTSVENTLEAGVSMPLGELKLLGKLGIGTNFDMVDQRLADKRVVVQTDAAYAPFTPTDWVLPGETAAEIANIQRYDANYYHNANSSFELAPSLFLGAELPLNLLANPMRASAGLHYDAYLYSYNANLKDSAGQNLKASTGLDRQNFSRVAGFDAVSGLFSTTTTVNRSFLANKYKYNTDHDMSLPLELMVEPNKGFRFGVSLEPNMSFGGSKYNNSQGSISTVTYDDGDGNARDVDTDDYETVTTVVNQPSEISSSNFSAGLEANVAVQIYLKQDKLRLNLGTSANNTFVNRGTTKTQVTGLQTTQTTRNSAGSTMTTVYTVTSPAVNEFSIVNYDSGSSVSINYEAGLTYFLNPNVALDFIVENDAAFNLAATTDSGGFFNLANWSFQMTVKLPPQTSAPKIEEE